MQRYKGFEPKASVGGSDPLPAGGYIVKILGAKEEPWKNGGGSSLVVSFDVSEGEYSGFFADQYKANTNENKKWKGNLRVTIPDENSEYFDSQKQTFNSTIGAIEESNAGYHLDWGPVERGDWSQLKGKQVGVLYRNKEYDVEGRTGWTTEAAYFTTVDYIHSGNIKIPKDKPLKNKPPVSTSGFASSASSGFAEITGEDDHLPF